MMAHDDNDPNDSASCTIMIVRSRRYKFCIEASDILSIGVRSERKFVRSRSRSEHRVRTTGIVVAQRIAAGRENVPRDKGKRFRVQNRHFRRHECIFVLANGQRNAKSRLHRWCIQRPTWCTVNEALGTPWLECRVAVCNGHGMRERKSCSLAEIHVRSAEIQPRQPHSLCKTRATALLHVLLTT